MRRKHRIDNPFSGAKVEGDDVDDFTRRNMEKDDESFPLQSASAKRKSMYSEFNTIYKQLKNYRKDNKKGGKARASDITALERKTLGNRVKNAHIPKMRRGSDFSVYERKHSISTSMPCLNINNELDHSSPKPRGRRMSFTGRILSPDEIRLRAELRDIRNGLENNVPVETKKKPPPKEKKKVPSLFRDNSRFQMNGGLITISDVLSNHGPSGKRSDIDYSRKLVNPVSSSRLESNLSSSRRDDAKKANSMPLLFKDNQRFQVVNGLITLE